MFTTAATVVLIGCVVFACWDHRVETRRARIGLEHVGR
jgi:hypothetical protein